MKYHIPLNPAQWTRGPEPDGPVEHQLVTLDFEDGYRLVVEVRRPVAAASMPIVQEARLEMRAQYGARAGQWQLVRRVRPRDVLLHDGPLGFPTQQG